MILARFYIRRVRMRTLNCKIADGVEIKVVEIFRCRVSLIHFVGV